MLSGGASELRLAWWREAYACAEECYCPQLHFNVSMWPYGKLTIDSVKYPRAFGVAQTEKRRGTKTPVPQRDSNKSPIRADFSVCVELAKTAISQVKPNDVHFVQRGVPLTYRFLASVQRDLLKR